MKPKTIEEKVEYYAMLHKQNLNGRETEDELFEAGILAGIEETLEEKDEFAIEFLDFAKNETDFDHWATKFDYKGMLYTSKELLEIFKKEKGYE